MRNLQFGLLAIFAFCGLIAPQSANALVNSATPVPATVTVSPTGGSVTITWRVVHTISAPATTVTSSPDYQFRIDGVLINTVAKVLTRTTTPTVGVPETLTYTETLPISAATAIQIANGNNNSTFTRTFNDGGGAQTAVARVIVGGATGELSINRIDLSFENGTKTKIINQSDQLHAIADVSYRARGLLEAEWRVIDSNSIRGGQFERVIGLSRHQLSAPGNGRIRIKSPRLPTDLSGLHQVRLFIRSPELRFEEPVLRYYVSPSAVTGAGRLQPMQVVQPSENALLGPDLQFAWLSVPGAAAYQIEIFGSGAPGNPVENLSKAPLVVGALDIEKRLVAGKVIPGDKTATVLARTTFQHLEHGREYLWRIRAINDNGNVLSQSALRKIRFP
ncbi:hypothetical protein GUA87_04890 [Sneathiella sp. P13V-1]|uniref:hypothetical protein n=1 Tax=Sneathiella sp. P13V-1 TaxID=2697366 RepID=UPI00187B8446|nr:hypothetical protein [Sneathiella sp. P13V-1]MBE7636170.1 hypothetical protein [Sneathiella sp. P13V-1]